MEDRMTDYLSFIDSVRGKQIEGGHNHHIIPRSIHRLTPSTVAVNDPSNMVRLSYEDHLMAHYLLYLALRKTGSVYAIKAALAYCYMIRLAFAMDNLPEPTSEMLKYYAEVCAIQKSDNRKRLGKPAAYLETLKSDPLVMSRVEMAKFLYGSASANKMQASGVLAIGARVKTAKKQIAKYGHPVRSMGSVKKTEKMGMVVDATGEWFKQVYPSYWVQDAS